MANNDDFKDKDELAAIEQQLAEIEAEVAALTPEQIDQELRKRGYDVDAMNRRPASEDIVKGLMDKLRNSSSGQKPGPQ